MVTCSFIVGWSFLVARTCFGVDCAGWDFCTALTGASAEYPLWEFLVGLGWSKSFSRVVKGVSKDVFSSPYAKAFYGAK